MSNPDWPRQIYEEFKSLGVRQVSYVPDAGHSALIRLCENDAEIHSVSLTTEEEGVALSGGAWLGGASAYKAFAIYPSAGIECGRRPA